MGSDAMRCQLRFDVIAAFYDSTGYVLDGGLRGPAFLTFDFCFAKTLFSDERMALDEKS